MPQYYTNCFIVAIALNAPSSKRMAQPMKFQLWHFQLLHKFLIVVTIGEICALKWSDIDVNTGTVTVQRTIERIYVIEGETRHTELVINTPKTQISKSEVIMNKI